MIDEVGGTGGGTGGGAGAPFGVGEDAPTSSSASFLGGQDLLNLPAVDPGGGGGGGDLNDIYFSTAVDVNELRDKDFTLNVIFN